MRSALAALLLLAVPPAHAEEAAVPVTAPAAAPAAPRTYALVAAFPDRFTVVHETPTRDRAPGASDRVDKYRRSSLEAPAGIFSRIALASLERAVSRNDPGSRYAYLVQPGDTPARLGAAQHEEYLLRRVRSSLEAMPQRKDWYRIVVALPAYRALDVDGLPGRLEGFGLFMQPRCQSDPLSCDQRFRPPSSPPTRDPDGEEIQANYFVAPYSYVAIVLLDPATLEVIDRERKLDFQRHFDPQAATLDLSVNLPPEVLAPKVVGLIERSIGGAIAQTELAGRVEIGTVKEVRPGASPGGGGRP
jgi:hypothetical protein